MEDWLRWARGPAFRFSIVLMLLGLLRLAVLNAINIANAVSLAGNKNIPWKKVIGDTSKWLFPYKTVTSHVVTTIVSILFHVSIIITPLFLGAHILLWNRGIGTSWAALPQVVADYLTLMAIATAIVLFVKRVSAKMTRSMSRPQDYILPLVIAVPFVSGYLAMHPAYNPFDYSATIFIHVMSGNIVMMLIPFSKMSHVVLFPTTQLVSEVAWHLAPGSGEQVALTLGKESDPI